MSACTPVRHPEHRCQPLRPTGRGGLERVIRHTIHERQSSIFGREVFFFESGTSANPLTIDMSQNRNVSVQLIPIGDGGENPVYDDPIEFPENSPRPGAFALTAPAHNTVYHQDRRPVLQWAAVPGASSYRVYLNVTRDDYDFSQPGSLLERYTLLGETSQTSWQTDTLPDRWTYRWSAGDTTHGYVTSFPTGVGMAATRDPSLAYEATNMQRVEHLVAGYRGTLGPIAEVGTKAIYPRIQEGGGEDADLVAAIIRAMIAGYQGGPELGPDSVLPTTKHWPGEGAGGEAGIVYDGVTIKYHMKPFHGAIEAGTGAVMPGYAGSDFLDPGGRGAGDSIGILAYLREVMGYDGLIMTDWLPSGAWIRAANAGSDVMGGADPANIDMNSFIAGVDSQRLHKALRRIFRVKFRLGIFENPYGDLNMVSAVHHSAAHVAIAEETAAASLTLLKNTSVLPFRFGAVASCWSPAPGPITASPTRSGGARSRRCTVTRPSPRRSWRAASSQAWRSSWTPRSRRTTRATQPRSWSWVRTPTRTARTGTRRSRSCPPRSAA